MKKIMNELRNSLLILMAIIVTASCSNHDDTVFFSEKNLLKVETYLLDSRNVVSGTSFEDGDQIGLFVKKEDGTAYSTITNCSNIKATYAHGAWILATDVELNEQETAYVYAYYPYNADIHVEGDSIDIDITPTTNDGQPDYMYGNAEASRKNPTAKIIFKHALARLTFAITKSETDKGLGHISQVTLQNAGVSQKLNTTAGIQYKPMGKTEYISIAGKMNLASGNIASIKDSTAIIMLSTDCKIKAEEVQYIDILVNPVSSSGIRPSNIVTNDVMAIFIVDGSQYAFPLKYPNWEAGEQYTYPITINRETIQEAKVEKVYLGFNGDDGKPLYWASHNLGANSPEDYGGLYGWADPTGEKTSTNLNDYPSTNPPADISGTEYDIARAMWGGGWRIPSNGEMWSLRANCTDEWTFVNGVEGVKFTSEVNGNSIFIPMAPIRTGDSIVHGQQSYYWLDAINKEDQTLAGTYYLDTYWDNNWPTAGKERYLGLPIRPVTSE